MVPEAVERKLVVGVCDGDGGAVVTAAGLQNAGRLRAAVAVTTFDLSAGCALTGGHFRGSERKAGVVCPCLLRFHYTAIGRFSEAGLLE